MASLKIAAMPLSCGRFQNDPMVPPLANPTFLPQGSGLGYFLQGAEITRVISQNPVPVISRQAMPASSKHVPLSINMLKIRSAAGNKMADDPAGVGFGVSNGQGQRL